MSFINSLFSIPLLCILLLLSSFSFAEGSRAKVMLDKRKSSDSTFKLISQAEGIAETEFLIGIKNFKDLFLESSVPALNFLDQTTWLCSNYTLGRGGKLKSHKNSNIRKYYLSLEGVLKSTSILKKEPALWTVEKEGLQSVIEEGLEVCEKRVSSRLIGRLTKKESLVFVLVTTREAVYEACSSRYEKEEVDQLIERDRATSFISDSLVHFSFQYCMPYDEISNFEAFYGRNL